VPGFFLGRSPIAVGEHERVELRFDDVIEESPDLVAPHRRDVEAILAFGRSLSAEPSSCAHLLVHCHAGVSRSTAAMTLILAQARPDLSAGSILSEVLRIRSKAWPNLRIIELGDALLGRNDEIVLAVPSLYREQLRIRPHLEIFFRAKRVSPMMKPSSPASRAGANAA
jgi:predicted protein tyrosine phosphatase